MDSPEKRLYPNVNIQRDQQHSTQHESLPIENYTTILKGELDGNGKALKEAISTRNIKRLGNTQPAYPL